MQKSDDSLRSRGLTVIAVDKPLRADIKSMAAKQGVTMVDYLRSKVEEDKQIDPQAVMVSNTAPATKADVNNVFTKIKEYILSGRLDADVMSTFWSAATEKTVTPEEVMSWPAAQLVHPESKLAGMSKEVREHLRNIIDKADELAEKQTLPGFEINKV